MAFGLFSGAALGSVGNSNFSRIQSLDLHQVYLTLDSEVENRILQKMLTDPRKNRNIQLYSSPCLHREVDPGVICYYVRNFAKDAKASRYHQVRLCLPETAIQLLEIAKGGISFQEVIDFLKSKAPRNRPLSKNIDTDLERVVLGWIEQQLLIPSPSQRNRFGIKYRRYVSKKSDLFLDLETPLKWSEFTKAQDRLEASLAKIHPDSQSDETLNNTLLHVDLIKGYEQLSLSQKTVEQIRFGALTLLKLFSGREIFYSQQGPLHKFQELFAKRYSRQEIPLLEAANLYAQFLMNEKTLPTTYPLQAADNYILNKILAQKDNSSLPEIRLEKEDLVKIEELDQMSFSQPIHLPPAFSVLATIVPPEKEKDHQRIFIDTVLGGSTTRHFSRYSFSGGPMETFAKNLAHREQKLFPEKILAEIHHLPASAKANNVSFTYGLFPASIPISCAPFERLNGKPGPKIILPEDLYLSVWNKFRLRSASHNQEVLPVVPNLYNHILDSHPVYRLLADLSYQNSFFARSWLWGPLIGLLTKPRISYENIIFSCAQWILTIKEVNSLKVSGTDFSSRKRALEKMRESRKIPRFVELVQADQKLPFDLEHPEHISCFLDSLKKDQIQILQECLQNPFDPGDKARTKDNQGHSYVSNVIVPFIAENFTAGSSLGTYYRKKDPPPVVPLKQRYLPPGSDCIYFKLYCDIENQDYLLTGPLDRWIRKYIPSHCKWFFVRYRDPDMHLRIRIFGKRLSPSLMDSLKNFAQKLLQDRLIHRFTFDTYEREIERYGGLHTLKVFENISHIDSEFCLKALKIRSHIKDNQQIYHRLFYIAASANRYFNDFSISLSDRLNFLSHQVSTSIYRKSPDVKDIKKEMFSVLKMTPDSLRLAEEMEKLMDERSKAMRSSVRELVKLYKTTDVRVPLESYIGALIHMSANRCSPLITYAHETVLYDFLRTRYISYKANKSKAVQSWSWY